MDNGIDDGVGREYDARVSYELAKLTQIMPSGLLAKKTFIVDLRDLKIYG
jgi:hypothetical protein